MDWIEQALQKAEAEWEKAKQLKRELHTQWHDAGAKYRDQEAEANRLEALCDALTAIINHRTAPEARF